MYDYSQDNENVDNLSTNDYIEICFSLIFIIEATLKIIGMGFVVHKNAYLKDVWNILDFVVV
jgi:voltage-dependent calcium channel L type alpha-1D